MLSTNTSDLQMSRLTPTHANGLILVDVKTVWVRDMYVTVKKQKLAFCFALILFKKSV